MPDKPPALRARKLPEPSLPSPGPVEVRGLGGLALVARDFPAQVAFYRDVLGLPVAWSAADAVVFRCGDQTLAVFAKSRHPQAVMRLDGARHGLSHLALSVDEGDRAVLAARLDAAGARAYGDHFEDPDGNLIVVDAA